MGLDTPITQAEVDAIYQFGRDTNMETEGADGEANAHQLISYIRDGMGVEITAATIKAAAQQLQLKYLSADTAKLRELYAALTPQEVLEVKAFRQKGLKDSVKNLGLLLQFCADRRMQVSRKTLLTAMLNLGRSLEWDETPHQGSYGRHSSSDTFSSAWKKNAPTQQDREDQTRRK